VTPNPPVGRRLRTLVLLPFMMLLFILPFPGTVTLRLVCLALAFAFAVALWWRLSPPRVPCWPALTLWALVALLSLIGAVDRDYSVGEIKNEVLYTMMAFVAFFAVARDEEDLKRLSVALFAGAAAICAWALEARFRLGGWSETSWGSGAVPGYAAVLLPLLFLYAAWSSRLWQRITVPGLFAIVCVTGFLSLQRIFIAVFVLQVVIAAVLLARKGVIRASRAAIFWGLIGIIVLAAGLLAVVQKERPPIAGDLRFSESGKVLERIAQNPVVGAGFGRGTMKKKYPDLVSADWMWHSHNIFLNYGLQIGIAGILVLVGVLFCLLRAYWRLYNSTDEKMRLLGIAGLALVLGVVLRNQLNDMLVRDASILFWAVNGALLGLAQRRVRPSVRIQPAS
jgi:O-antigen ligase